MERDVSAIKKLLAIMVVILAMYMLNVLSFIFIPLTFGLFIALLFTPTLRWLTNRKMPLFIGVIMVLLIITGIFMGAYKVVELTSKELRAVDKEFLDKLDYKLNEAVRPIVRLMDIELKEGQTEISALLNNEKVISNLFNNVGSGITIAKDFLVILLMSLFFMILFLVGSVNIQKVLEALVFKEKEMSANAYREIERGVLTFVSVKTFVSILTGLGIGISCYFFGVSFPTFWGLAAFLLNFVQLIGSTFVVLALSFFAFVELNTTGSLLFFIIVIAGVQLLIGSVLEPILLGRSFSINTITILVMLATWGVVWGVPGLVLSIPITAMLKIVLEKFPKTNVYAKLMS